MKLKTLKDIETWNDWDNTGGENVNSNELREIAMEWVNMCLINAKTVYAYKEVANAFISFFNLEEEVKNE